MLDLTELRQLVVFADCGRLYKAAETLNLSQPTVTRTMQHLEDEFGVPLFDRTKNSISFNATGEKAAALARQLLLVAERTVEEVRDFESRQHVLSVLSCAPAPLWYILPQLSHAHPDKTLSSAVKEEAEIISSLKEGKSQLAVLTYKPEEEGICSFPFLEEKLSVCVTPDHPLSRLTELTFSDINGYNFLLASNLGFWDRLCRERMPASHFHVQTSEIAMLEIIKESTLPCFVTDLSDSRRGRSIEGRIKIPVTDKEANVTYFLAYREENASYAALLRRA